MDGDDCVDESKDVIITFGPEFTEEKVEAWLDGHPNFVQSYFTRKANRALLDLFLRHTRAPTRSRASTPPVGGIGESHSPLPSRSSSHSGTSTPVRKISASDFESKGILKPLVSLVDGSPSFLSLERNFSLKPTRQRKSKEELQHLRVVDEQGFLMEIVKDIASDLDLKSLCHKILQNVSILLNADRCSLFLIQGPKEGPRFLVSEVFDVNADSKVEDVQNLDPIRLPWGKGIVGYSAETGESVNIPDAYKDSRFNQGVDLQTGYKTKSILCMPLKNCEGEVIGVAQVINKIEDSREQAFTEEDEKIFDKYLVFCGLGISNAELFERAHTEIRRNQVLLDLTRIIFEEPNLHNIVHKIMMNTQSLLQCERCSILLVDPTSKGLFSQAFDLEARECLDDDGETVVRKQSCGSSEVKFPINIGITGYVATTGETLNIPDAYADPRFDPSVDEGSGFKTRSILCMPIKRSNEEIVGVVQLLNKMDGLPFNENDINLFEAFAIFCAMAIHNTTMFEECLRAMARQKVALEVLSYHASAPEEEASKLKSDFVPSATSYRLTDFSFDDAVLTDRETCLGTLRMFLDLQFVEYLRIDYRIMCKWLLSVKKNYRNVTYHNWRHAFNVTQMMFAILKCSTLLNSKFSKEEQLALMVGCLCHDLDHRGTNNTFQIKSESPLAQLYTTSVMEHHHFDHCIMILNSAGQDILKNLSSDTYNQVISLLEHSILSTDLALYFKKRKDFFDLVETKCFDIDDDNHRNLLRSMLMTACDISAITKPWVVQRRVAHLVAEEFFEQGDKERGELNTTPMEMMDRQKKDKLPQMQVGFIDGICLPVYQILAEQFKELETLVKGCLANKTQWQKLAKSGKKF